MKRTIFITALMVFIAMIFSASCNYHEEKTGAAQQPATQYLEMAPKDSLSDFQQFKEEENYKINDNERSLISLKSRMMNVKQETYEIYQTSIAILEKRNNALRMKIDNYKDDGTGKWEVFKTSFNNDMDALSNDFKNISD